MNISLRQLRVLMVVARHRSFTEAAKAIGLSQSAVSLNIRQVEQQLGLRLFDRTTRRVQLTEIGAAVFSSSARLIDELDTVLREARDIGAQRRGTAVVAAVPSVVNRLIPGCIAACATEHPHVRVV